MALIDHTMEHIPEDPDAPLDVPIPDLAHRVLELYWSWTGQLTHLRHGRRAQL
jgi:hypothetical protein